MSGTLALDSPVTVLAGIGPESAEKLRRLNIETIGDLVLHLPFRYQDRTRSVPLADLVPGVECLVTGRVASVNVSYGRRRALVVTIAGRDTIAGSDTHRSVGAEGDTHRAVMDTTDEDTHADGDTHADEEDIADRDTHLAVRFFHFSARQRKGFEPGLWMRCFGEVRRGPLGLEMVHPEYRLHAEEPGPPTAEQTPIYRVTQGLTPKRLGQWIDKALDGVADAAFSRLPDEQFPDLLTAIRFLHRPDAEPGAAHRIEAARARVALDEFVGHYLVLKHRQALAKTQSTLPLPSRRQLGRELLHQLGFRLTRAQARVTSEVLGDLDTHRPMMRLLQGDVGSGKTVVAAFAAIRAAEHGYQTAIMAPTEILAEQHFETLSLWLPPLGIDVGLLTGRQSAAERRTRLAAVAEGRDLVVIGTHALFQTGVEFRALALAIIDEQHRFGVHQRMLLRDKGRLPHQLVMTATPIPRTLTMALYADMDVSTIDELPPGREPVRTHLATMSRREEVIERVARTCRAGRQVYWVCTLIEEEEEAVETGRRLHAAVATHEELLRALPDGLRVGLVHGRLPPVEKGGAMAAFKTGEIDVLVATTVIEVGVDVPNATLMVIDNAERLGLAQLHQLRGRVGRGGGRSSCILLYEPPLSEVARQRLSTMRETNDGFTIAEKDLELRGPGDVLGTRQTGEQTFKLADLSADRALVPKAVRLGDRLLADDAATARTVVETWARGDVEYASV